MPQKLATVLAHLEKMENLENKRIILEYHKYLVSRDTSANYQKDNIKLVMMLANFLENQTFGDVKSKEIIMAFLDTKRKQKDIDPEQKWITTWNDYLWRIKMFYRWYYNFKIKNMDVWDANEINGWVTPEIVNINKKKTKRLSPYSEGDIWEKEELLTIVKYEPYKRNKAILTLLWDLNARPHEITLLRIKNIRLRENYGEGEVPHEAKTGSGPILLLSSFPYVRDWLNEHPFSGEPNARLICNKVTGAPVTPDSIWDMMRQLQKRISRLLKDGEIKDQKEEKQKEAEEYYQRQKEKGILFY